MNSVKIIKFVSWNVRGLNDKDKRSIVKHEIHKERPQLICIQETKWQKQDVKIVKETVGARYTGLVTIQAKDTAGGVMIAWDENFFTCIYSVVEEHCASVDLVLNLDNTVFRFTGVYGPSNSRDKGPFFRELLRAKPGEGIPWMVAGDFNVTLKLEDRSNSRHPQHSMMRFRELVNRLELLDLTLHVRKYTWSKEGQNPTFVRLDRFMVNSEWTSSYPNTIQKAAIASISNHCLLICTSHTKFPTANIFRIENTWLKDEEFKQMVCTIWTSMAVAQDPNSHQTKIKALTRSITRWKKEHAGRSNIQKHVTNG